MEGRKAQPDKGDSMVEDRFLPEKKETGGRFFAHPFLFFCSIPCHPERSASGVKDLDIYRKDLLVKISPLFAANAFIPFAMPMLAAPDRTYALYPGLKPGAINIPPLRGRFSNGSHVPV